MIIELLCVHTICTEGERDIHNLLYYIMYIYTVRIRMYSMLTTSLIEGGREGREGEREGGREGEREGERGGRGGREGREEGRGGREGREREGGRGGREGREGTHDGEIEIQLCHFWYAPRDPPPITQ